ncbi:NADP-dependent oxidoreductase domain-containing protein [Aspergillus insuetus]
MPPAPPPPLRSVLHCHRQLAPNASIRVSPLCLGTMNFGDAWKGRMGECSKETTFQILDRFFDKGGNFIDTANAYQDEQSEMWLGEWIATRNNRDQIVLATVYSASLKGYDKDLIQSTYGGNGAKSMRLSLEASLKKLQTNYIDLFYVHWWDYTTTIPELMHALNDLVVSGKVVSKATQYARDHGLRQFVTQAALLEREQNGGGRKSKPPTQTERAVSQALEEIGTQRDKPVTSIALAYIMYKTPYVFAIVGGRKVEHLGGNIDALEIALEAEEVERVEAAFEFDPGFPHTFLSGTLFTEERPRAAQKPDDVWLLKLMEERAIDSLSDPCRISSSWFS